MALIDGFMGASAPFFVGAGENPQPVSTPEGVHKEKQTEKLGTEKSAKSLILNWSRRKDSNPRPAHYKFF